MVNGAIRVIDGGTYGATPDAFGYAGVDTGVAVLSIVLRFTIWVLLILAAVWVAREILTTIRGARAGRSRATSPALAELEMLYARGEVSRTDYLARRADLAGPPPPAPGAVS